MAHYPSSRKLNDETALAVKEVLSLRPNTKHVKHVELCYEYFLYTQLDLIWNLEDNIYM